MRRADPHRALIRALLARYPQLLILSATAEPWASATFTGARHELVCDGAPELGGIEEADFKLPGHIVADVAVEQRDGTTIIEALLIEKD